MGFLRPNPAAGGSGTVTTVSVVTANGMAGTVATATTTPAITIVPRSERRSHGRLTPLSGTPITTTDQSGALAIYFTPYSGDYIDLYDGTNWNWYQFAEQMLLLTDLSQTGTMTNGAKTITGLTSTAQLVRGMKVTGTSIGANATISSIDSATQVTVSVNSTASTTNQVNFYVGNTANTVYDVFYVWNGGSPRFQFGPAWTNSTTRAAAISLQNGVYLNTSAINASDSNGIAAQTGRYLGTVVTGVTAGQTHSTTLRRLIFNAENRVPMVVSALATASSWTYNSTTVRAANTDNTLRVEIANGIQSDPIEMILYVLAGGYAYSPGFGEDRTNGNDSTTIALIEPNNTAGLFIPGFAALTKIPALGYHYYQWVEAAADAATTTSYGVNAGVRQSGIVGTWKC